MKVVEIDKYADSPFNGVETSYQYIHIKLDQKDWEKRFITKNNFFLLVCKLMNTNNFLNSKALHAYMKKAFEKSWEKLDKDVFRYFNIKQEEKTDVKTQYNLIRYRNTDIVNTYIAILFKEGLITSEKTVKRRYRNYLYRDTFYRLTEKGKKHLQELK